MVQLTRADKPAGKQRTSWVRLASVPETWRAQGKFCKIYTPNNNLECSDFEKIGKFENKIVNKYRPPRKQSPHFLVKICNKFMWLCCLSVISCTFRVLLTCLPKSSVTSRTCTKSPKYRQNHKNTGVLRAIFHKWLNIIYGHACIYTGDVGTLDLTHS